MSPIDKNEAKGHADKRGEQASQPDRLPWIIAGITHPFLH